MSWISIIRLLPFLSGVALFTAGTAIAGNVDLPQQAPVPLPREQALPREEKSPEKPASAGLPAGEEACRTALRDLGAAFAEAPAVAATGGCSLPHPVEVTQLSREIRIEPPVTLECATALTAARFFQIAGTAVAKKHLKAGIAIVQQASGYVCRPINGLKKLSEHAFGKALDVTSITLASGTRIQVEGHRKGSKEAAFLGELRTAACGPFSTVLGPGTDAAHALHFHFDTKSRKRPYCR